MTEYTLKVTTVTEEVTMRASEDLASLLRERDTLNESAPRLTLYRVTDEQGQPREWGDAGVTQ